MRSLLFISALTPILAYPTALIPASSGQPFCQDSALKHILRFDEETSYVQFLLPSTSSTTAEADESLVLDISVPQCHDSNEECFDVIVNGQYISLDLSGQPAAELSAIHTTVSVPDTSGTIQELLLHVAIASEPQPSIPSSAGVRLSIEGPEAEPTALSNIELSWTRGSDSTPRLESLEFLLDDDDDRDSSPNMADFNCFRQDEHLQPLIDHIDAFEDDTMEKDYIISETAALLKLEQQVIELDREIRARAEALERREVQYRSRQSLQQLLDQCDGIICSAKAIATRLCDNIDLAINSKDGYHRLQQPLDEDSRQNSTTNATSLAAQNQPVSDHSFIQDLGSSNDYFTKALAYIASALGLLALFGYIRKKCMSVRNRVERAADREERRNARAYRRAARRAEMRRRWDGLLAVLCIKPKEEPRMTDYDEKRALILQDALLEQDFSQLERGDIMEAEIRQLRHAHEIVSSILHRSDKPVKDPPPPLVPLPTTPARSRASTGTLPSYSSEEPPDYSSIPDPTNENTTTDGFAYYQPTNSNMSTGDYRYYQSTNTAASTSSGPTRSTPISSVAGLSPRVSMETLRTRASRVDSRCTK